MDLSSRRPGPDVVRALAMAGVVIMNYHGYLLLRGGARGSGPIDDLFDPWTGPLSTRFAATFVLTAGVGVTLMTASSRADPARVGDMRWRLVRRGLLLYSGGLLFDFIWPGTILPFYGAMFVLAALMFTWRARWLLAVGAAAAIAGWLIRWWRYEREVEWERARFLAVRLGLEEAIPEHPTRWLTDPPARSPRGLLFDVAVNGTHPLLPWLAFFCAGMLLARLFGEAWWRPVAIGAGAALYTVATIVSTAGTSPRALVLLGDDPFDRGVLYTASALGTALVAFGAISWVADQFAATPAVDALRRAGQMSLTIYLGHAFVFNVAVDWFGLLGGGGLGVALLSAAGYWLVATALAVRYQRRYGRGPAERVYRLLTA